MSAHGLTSKTGRVCATTVLLLAFLVASLPGAVAAEEQGPWRGEYYDNENLSGTPKLVRTDAVISFDWGLGSPGSGIPNEHFSVRWTAFLNFAAGTYLFTTHSDDGVRLWIDEVLLIDQWHIQAAISHEALVSLTAGYHYIRLEYFDHTDRAVVRFFWQRVGEAQPVTGWQGEYFANIWLSGSPTFTRTDAEINFDWGNGSPGSGIPADNFSVRWTRQVYFEGGNYTFYTATDDGVRVWLDGSIIIDRWFDQSATTYAKTVYVTTGTHPLRVEYYERAGVAKARFWWQRSGVTPTPAPPVTSAEIIVDNTSPGFAKGGLISSWYLAYIGYGGSTYWTYNSVYQVYNYATWTPTLPGAGYYDVYVFVPRNYADTRSARYRVFHNGQRHDVWVAQALYFDKWVRLGNFYFHGRGGEYVFLSDNTHEAYASKRIAFDAVKFVLTGVAAAPAPTATPVPSYGCAIVPQAGFGRVWTSNATVRSRLGCALEPEKSVPAAEESFQYGLMFWRSDTRTIYALYRNGVWQSITDRWQEGDPVSDPSIVPPWGYYQPVRGFGKAWREEPGVRERLGWATEPERGFNAAIETFERGLMIWSNVKGIYVLYRDGTWQRFD